MSCHGGHLSFQNVRRKLSFENLFRLFRLVYLCQMNSEMETVLEKPTQREQKLASDLLSNFNMVISQRKSDTVNIQIQESLEIFTIPRRALEFLSHILSSMAAGKAISLIPSDSEVSTQQAADMLNVSRPHIVKLLEQGVIPFKKTGSHRRILMDDLVKYAEQQKETRNKSFKFLAEQAQELNLGYE
jgi:excisionase family DNA binding protein